jgi:hypothetical protein
LATIRWRSKGTPGVSVVVAATVAYRGTTTTIAVAVAASSRLGRAATRPRSTVTMGGLIRRRISTSATCLLVEVEFKAEHL